MSTLRKNAITGNIVIFASGRRGRPRQTADTRSADLAAVTLPSGVSPGCTRMPPGLW